MSLSASSFVESAISTADIEASERIHGPLADDLRRVIDVAIRTEVDPDRIAAARDLVQQVERILAEKASPDPAGIQFNAEGTSWNWGNAVVGIRNAIAPPVILQWADDGSVSSVVDLGVAYEGPPGCVHGGVSALLMDHLMGETASATHTRLIVTGTLTLRYARPLPLGRIRMEARIASEAGRKVTVIATIGPDGGSEPSVEAEGLFIMPSWSVDQPGSDTVGSLD